MADIDVPHGAKELLGRKILRVLGVLPSGDPAKDQAELTELLEKPDTALKNLVHVPAGHTIEVEEMQPDRTRMLLPLADDLKDTLAKMQAGTFSYPLEYTKGSATYIDPKLQPERALSFLLGDYILKKCK